MRPLHIDYRGYDLYTPTLPAGGLTTLSILKTLEQFDLSKFEPWGARYIELFAGASNLCWKERFEYFGDPDFVNVPIADLLSEKRAIARAEMLRKGIATPVSRPSEPPGTVNFVIIDKDRNMISWTATHGGGFGSHVAIEGLGLMLGHGMSRFAFTAPDPNYPAPGKRPQHNMSPLLVLHGGKPYAALGMPGGRAIVTFTAQMVGESDRLQSSSAAHCFLAPYSHRRPGSDRTFPSAQASCRGASQNGSQSGTSPILGRRGQRGDHRSKNWRCRSHRQWRAARSSRLLNFILPLPEQGYAGARTFLRVRRTPAI